MRRSLLPIVLVAVTAATWTAVVAGYQLYGQKWPTSRVLYYVNPQNIYESQSAVIQAIQTAASGWKAQSQANIELVYGGTTNGSSLTLNYKNEVFFRNEAGGGATYRWYDSGGNLLDADIVIYQGGRPLFTGTSGCVGGIYIEDLATHEFGHVLGLGHSGDSTATMYQTTSYCSMNWRSLASDDIAGIQKVYPGTTSTTSQVPSAPSNLLVSLNTLNLTSSLLLSWRDNSSNETGFVLERSTDGASFSQIAQLGANTTLYTNLSLLSGTSYYYRVAAFNGSGRSAYSNIASGQTQSSTSSSSAPTLSATGFKVKGRQNTKLTWSGFTTSSVDVYRNGVRVVTTGNDGVHTDVINVKGSASYTYRLCGTGTTSCSNSVTVTF